MANKLLSSSSIKKRLIEIFKSETAYFEALKKARADLITYFDKSKLYLLFTKAVDACPYIDFSTPRDRRVNKSFPIYKLKIDFSKLPDNVRMAASRKGKISDAKTCIIHMGVLGPYLDMLMEAIKNNDMTVLKEPVPKASDRSMIEDYLSAMYIMDTSEEAVKPVFVRQII